MLVKHIPEKVVTYPSHDERYYTYDELGEKAQENALENMRDELDWEIDRTFDDINSSVKAFERATDVFDGCNGIQSADIFCEDVRLVDDIEEPDYYANLRPLGEFFDDSGLYCDLDISQAYNAALPPMRMALYAYQKAVEWHETATYAPDYTEYDYDPDWRDPSNNSPRAVAARDVWAAENAMDRATDAYMSAARGMKDTVTQAINMLWWESVEYYQSGEYLKDDDHWVYAADGTPIDVDSVYDGAVVMDSTKALAIA